MNSLKYLTAACAIVLLAACGSTSGTDPVVSALDADGDGVPDISDSCADSPTNVAVDSSGCAVDSDGDGSPDYADRCAATPAGATVDEWGCPD